MAVMTLVVTGMGRRTIALFSSSTAASRPSLQLKSQGRMSISWLLGESFRQCDMVWVFARIPRRASTMFPGCLADFEAQRTTVRLSLSIGVGGGGALVLV